METDRLDIGPLDGTALVAALLLAIGNCAPEIGRTTLITSGGRPLAVLSPVTAGGSGRVASPRS